MRYASLPDLRVRQGVFLKAMNPTMHNNPQIPRVTPETARRLLFRDGYPVDDKLINLYHRDTEFPDQELETATYNACKQLDGDPFKMYYFACCHHLGLARLSSVRDALGWNERKASRVLTKLCSEGWALRLGKVWHNQVSYASGWILVFPKQLPPELRSSEVQRITALKGRLIPDHYNLLAQVLA